MHAKKGIARKSIERCLMDVIWNYRPYERGRLAFMCPPMFTYPQLPWDNSHGRCPPADRTTTRHRRCEEEYGLLGERLQVKSNLQRRGEPENTHWPDLHPKQKHSYASFMHKGILSAQVASQCLDEYDKSYQI